MTKIPNNVIKPPPGYEYVTREGVTKICGSAQIQPKTR